MRRIVPISRALRCRQAVDASGFAVFADGTQGAAHAEAHAALDTRRYAQGYRDLGAWLDSHSGSGSEWIHLQFHMALFELELGLWNAAYTRFMSHVLPASQATADALTDAPGLSWRLALAARTPVTLPWESLRATALVSTDKHPDAWIQIHNLLAFAGAGDLSAIERVLVNGAPLDSARVVEDMALALHAHTRGSFGETAQRLDDLIPRLPTVGGSRAQLDLFSRLRQRCRQRASGTVVVEPYARAA